MTDTFDERARPFIDAGILALADVHAIRLTAPRFGETDPTRMLGLAFAVRAPRLGHVGVDLANVAEQIDVEWLTARSTALVPGGDANFAEDGSPSAPVPHLPWPDPATWHERTLTSPLVGAEDDRDHPFARQDLGSRSLLLTRRMYREQQRLASALRLRASLEVPDGARIADLDAVIATLFPDHPAGEAALAVRLAANACLTIVIGGPGTGKTFSVARLLAALLMNRRRSRPLLVELVAPTGKAAVRLGEAIREALTPTLDGPWDVDPEVRAVLHTIEARTIHRLIGQRPDGSTRHDPNNPLPADVVIVDETSMVDLGLMRRLLEALQPDARLVLLGDKDQLASVEAGTVLADLVGDGTGPLARNVQSFSRSYRFESAPDLALIAACLQSYPTALVGVPTSPIERTARAVEVFLGRAHALTEVASDRRVTHLGDPTAATDSSAARPSEAQLDALAAPYLQGFTSLAPGAARPRYPGYAELLRRHLLPSGRFHSTVEAPSFQRSLLAALDRYRVLAVHRRGPLGVAGLESALAFRVRASLGRERESEGRHWLGRPIVVTENANDLGLTNGDVGVVLPTAIGPAGVFPHERPEAVRIVALSRLPPHEGALAMTVHKAQGSQFDRVALVLAGRPSPIQTRELVYTGATRARDQLAWLGTETELRLALDRRVERASGLGALLR